MRANSAPDATGYERAACRLRTYRIELATKRRNELGVGGDLNSHRTSKVRPTRGIGSSGLSQGRYCNAIVEPDGFLSMERWLLCGAWAWYPHVVPCPVDVLSRSSQREQFRYSQQDVRAPLAMRHPARSGSRW